MVFLNTAPIQKEFKRFVVPREEANLTELKGYDVENVIFKDISLNYTNYNYHKFDVYVDIITLTSPVFSEEFTYTDISEVYDQISKTLLSNSSYKAADFYKHKPDITIYYYSDIVLHPAIKIGKRRIKNHYVTYHSNYNNLEDRYKRERITTHLYKGLTPTIEVKQATDSILYKNDKHIDNSDPNLHTILDFNYNPELDNTDGNLSDEIKTKVIIDNETDTQEYTKLFNYDTVKNFNSQRVNSSYYTNYLICNNTLDMSNINSDENGIIYNNNTDETEALEKAFQFGVLVWGGNNASVNELTTEAYKKFNDKVTDNNVKYIYDNILYSSKYLKWIYDLKDSHDTINELKSK